MVSHSYSVLLRGLYKQKRNEDGTRAGISREHQCFTFDVTRNSKAKRRKRQLVGRKR